MMKKVEKQNNRKRTFAGRFAIEEDKVMQILKPTGAIPSAPPPPLQISQHQSILGDIPSANHFTNHNPFLNSLFTSTLPPPPPPPPPLPVYSNYQLLPHYYMMNPPISMDPIQNQFSLMTLNHSSLPRLTEPSAPVTHPSTTEIQDWQHSESTSKVAHIGVFWDIENCGVPRGKSAMVVVQMIRNRFYQPNYVEAEFITVCDIRKESAQVIQELNDAQVTVIHVSGISKNAADDKLRQAMRRYADAYSLVGRSTESSKTHGTPAIVLISGDVNFASDLSDLRHRKRLHVILLHNPHTPETLLACAHEHHDFHSGLEGIPIRGTQSCASNGGGGTSTNEQFHDILVIGLPPATTKGKIAQLKTRLKRLSDNCGGKVAQVTNQQAVIRFKSREAAMRACKRMDGEDVLGVKIRTLITNNFGIYSPSTLATHGSQPLLPLTSPLPYSHLTPVQVQPINHWQSPGLPTGPPPSSSEWNMWTSPSLVQTTPQNKPIITPTPKKKQVLIKPATPVPTAIKQEPKAKPSLSSDTASSSSSKSDENEREASEEVTTTDSNVAEEDVLRIVKEEQLSSPPPPPALEQRPDSSEEDECSGSGSNLRSSSSASDDTSSDPPTVTEQPQYPRTNLIHVVTEFESFGSRVKELLILEGTLELSQFLIKYASTHGSLTEVDEEKGVPVEHLLNAVAGVGIAAAPLGERMVRKVKGDEHGEQSAQKFNSGSTQLRVEIMNLLKTFPRCTIPISQLPISYTEYYGKELVVCEYGEETIKDLMVNLLGSTVHLMGAEPDVYLTLTHEVQMKRFAVDMLRILKSKDTKEISLNGFSEAFLTVTGRIFEAGDYGLCSLRDLIKELILRTSHIILVQTEQEISVKLA